MKYLLWIAVAFCAVFFSTVNAAPYEDDSKYSVDKEYARELANLIYQANRREPSMFASAHKRNSELVNTLLGLPKVLNDAGRK